MSCFINENNIYSHILKEIQQCYVLYALLRRRSSKAIHILNSLYKFCVWLLLVHHNPCLAGCQLKRGTQNPSDEICSVHRTTRTLLTYAHYSISPGVQTQQTAISFWYEMSSNALVPALFEIYFRLFQVCCKQQFESYVGCFYFLWCSFWSLWRD